MAAAWTFLRERLENGEPVVAVVVTASTGSAPGKAGFLMGVSSGEAAGTVGGGVMEHELQQLARRLLTEKAASPRLEERVHRAHAPGPVRSGLICAGSQQVALVPLHPRRLEPVRRAERAAAAPRGTWDAVFSSRGFALTAAQTPGGFSQTGGDWEYRLPLGREAAVFVVGAGHVGRAVCTALAPLDLQVTSVDHRRDPTGAGDPRADAVWVCPYAELRDRVPGGEQVLVAVVTSALPHDVEALFALWDKPLGYLGLMGSRAKVARIFAELAAREVPAEALSRIRTPIGLDIGATTPAEIGLSVAAELVAVVRGAHRRT